MKNIYASALVAATLAVGAPAYGDVVVQTAQPSNVLQREVRFADLNLDTPMGVDRLNMRIASAVRYVCGQRDTRVLPEYMAMRQCRDRSLEQAFADRDAILSARLAARGQPEKLAALNRTMAIGVVPRR